MLRWLSAATRCRLVILAFLLLAPVPLQAQQPATLGARLDQILAAPALAGSEVGVAVIPCGRPGAEPLFAHDATAPLIPASNQKLLVTGAAISLLGPDHELTTEILAHGRLAAGTLDGDLVVRGGGDPMISGRFHGDDATEVLDSWAQQLLALGVHRITGDVVADGRLFTDATVHRDWPRDQLQRWYAAPVSALALQDNCLDLIISAGPSAGAPAVIRSRPETGSIEVVNQIDTTAARERHLINVARPQTSDTVTVTGHFWSGAGPFETEVTVRDPLAYFAGVFTERIRAAGIEVGGGPRVAAREDSLDGAALLFAHRQSLLPVLAVINKRSQNLHAEILLKLLGARLGGDGSWEGGARVVTRWAREAAGIPEGRLAISDGSGLARSNHVAALDLARLLSHLQGQERTGPLFVATLSIGGVDGSLEDRFTDPALRGRVIGKTGTISGVSALSGYVTRTDGTVLAFSILMNGVRSVADARAVQDRLVEALAGP